MKEIIVEKIKKIIEIIKKIIEIFCKKKNFWPRLVCVLVAVIMMGFSLSWLILVNLGTDPCTLMNVAIANTLGTSLGNWQALLNMILLVVVLSFGGRNLGFGTLANMFLVGYSVDFFSWVWSRVLPEGLFLGWGVRLAVLVPALILFILAAAVYMDMDMGTAPYDAIPFIIAKQLPQISFRIIRMVYDMVVTLIGLFFGGSLGIVTVLMAITLGPVIAWVGEKINEKWDLNGSSEKA